MAYMVALDTFVTEIDGVPFTVTKGQVLHAKHQLVALDAGRGVLFAPLEEGEEAPPLKRAHATKPRAPRAAAQAEAEA